MSIAADTVPSLSCCDIPDEFGSSVYDCALCPFLCTSQDVFQSHLQQEHKSNFLPCVSCSKLYSTSRCLVKHVEWFHRNLFVYCCGKHGCDFKTTLYKTFLFHLVKCLQSSFPCYYCKAAFSTPESLIAHLEQRLSLKQKDVHLCFINVRDKRQNEFRQQSVSTSNHIMNNKNIRGIVASKSTLKQSMDNISQASHSKVRFCTPSHFRTLHSVSTKPVDSTFTVGSSRLVGHGRGAMNSNTTSTSTVSVAPISASSVISTLPSQNAIVLPKNTKVEHLKAFSINQGLMKAKFIIMTSTNSDLKTVQTKSAAESIVRPSLTGFKHSMTTEFQTEQLANNTSLMHCDMSRSNLKNSQSYYIEPGEISANVLCSADASLPRISQVGSEHEILASLSSVQSSKSCHSKSGTLVSSPTSSVTTSRKVAYKPINISFIKEEPFDSDDSSNNNQGRSDPKHSAVTSKDFHSSVSTSSCTQVTCSTLCVKETDGDFCSNESELTTVDPLFKMKTEHVESPPVTCSMMDNGVHSENKEDENPPQNLSSPYSMSSHVLSSIQKDYSLPYGKPHIKMFSESDCVDTLSSLLSVEMKVGSADGIETFQDESITSPSSSLHDTLEASSSSSVISKEQVDKTYNDTSHHPVCTPPLFIKQEVDENLNGGLLAAEDYCQFNHHSSNPCDIGKINSAFILNPVEDEETILPSPADIPFLLSKDSFYSNGIGQYKYNDHSSIQYVDKLKICGLKTYPSDGTERGAVIEHDETLHEDYRNNLHYSSWQKHSINRMSSIDHTETKFMTVNADHLSLDRGSLDMEPSSLNEEFSAHENRADLASPEVYSEEGIQFNSTSFPEISDASTTKRASNQEMLEYCSDSSSFDEFTAPLVIDEGKCLDSDVHEVALQKTGQSLSLQDACKPVQEASSDINDDDCHIEDAFIEKSSLTVRQILKKFKCSINRPYKSRKPKNRAKKRDAKAESQKLILDKGYHKSQKFQNTKHYETRMVEERDVMNKKGKFSVKTNPSLSTVQSGNRCDDISEIPYKSSILKSRLLGNGNPDVASNSRSSAINNPNSVYFLVNSSTNSPLMFVDGSTKKLNLLLVKVPQIDNKPLTPSASFSQSSDVQVAISNTISCSSGGNLYPVSTFSQFTPPLKQTFVTSENVPMVYQCSSSDELEASTSNISLPSTSISGICPSYQSTSKKNITLLVKFVNKHIENNSSNEVMPTKSMTQCLAFWKQRKTDTGLQNMSLTSDFFKCMLENCMYTTNSPSDFSLHYQQHAPFQIECPYCLKVFPNGDSIVQHSVLSHRRRVFQCSLCFYRACTKIHVQFHILTYHPNCSGVTLTGTPICIEQASVPEEPLELHVGMKLIVCPFEQCQFSSSSISDVSYHLWKHPNVNWLISKEHHCQECRSKFVTILDWMNHLKSHDVYLLQCLFCTFGCNRRPQMLNHLTSRHADNPLMTYVRTSEQLLFILECYLNANRNVPFKSIQCCSSPSNCYCYLLPCPEFEGNSNRINNLLENVKTKKMHFKAFECLYCDSKASSIAKMEKHLKKEHPTEMQLKYYHCISHPISSSDIKEMLDFRDDTSVYVDDSYEFPTFSEVIPPCNTSSAPVNSVPDDPAVTSTVLMKTSVIAIGDIKRFKVSVMQHYFSNGTLKIIFFERNPYFHIFLPFISYQFPFSVHKTIVKFFWHWIYHQYVRFKSFKCNYCPKQFRVLKDLRHHWKNTHVQGGKKFSYSITSSSSKHLHSTNNCTFYKFEDLLRHSGSRVTHPSIEVAHLPDYVYSISNGDHIKDIGKSISGLKANDRYENKLKRRSIFSTTDSEPPLKMKKIVTRSGNSSSSQSSRCYKGSYYSSRSQSMTSPHSDWAQLLSSVTVSVFFNMFHSPVRIPILYLQHLVNVNPQVSVIDVKEQIILTHKGFYDRRSCKKKKKW